MVETATALRSQLKDQLRTRIGQTQDLLNAYYEAYPHLGQGEPTLQQPVALQGTWSEVGQTLATQPMSGVNVHARPEGLRPSWIAEQTIEPVEFGSLADPISQLAFLAAPGMLRAGKSALETVAAPGPSRRVRALGSEAGNLGPVPRNAQGQPLPESAVRGPQGELKRLYHGTGRGYADFEMAQAGSGAGGNLYGPGIYMTESPDIASQYAVSGMPGGPGSQAAIQSRLDYARTQRLIAAKARAAGKNEIAQAYEAVAQSAEDQAGNLFGAVQANIRPVYADLKRPFDINKVVDVQEAAPLMDAVDMPLAHVNEALRERVQRGMTGQDFYDFLVRMTGDKAEANKVLQDAGYDGITHIGGAVTGGQPHRVYIAFSPDQVYPSVNVEGAP